MGLSRAATAHKCKPIPVIGGLALDATFCWATTAHNCKPVPVIGALALDATDVELRPLTNVSQLPVKVLQGPEVVISQLVLLLVVLLHQREPATQFDSLESTLLHRYTSSCLLLHYRELAAQFDPLESTLYTVMLLFHVVLLWETATQFYILESTLYIVLLLFFMFYYVGKRRISLISWYAWIHSHVTFLCSYYCGKWNCF